MQRTWPRLALLAGLCSASPALSAETPPRVRVVSGVDSTGLATDQWLDILRRRLTPARLDSLRAIRRPLSADERDWSAMIELHSKQWPAEVAAVAAIFEPAGLPESILVVLGNRGGEDAFTHDATTMAFDLSALQRVYGAAGDAENALRIDRFFRHELTHLLQKRWLALHPWPASSPLRVALLDIWTEGLGNVYSLSERWRPIGGMPAAATTSALAKLEPLFVARLSALACADSARGAALLAGLSNGPFEQKWGALPAALWLADEARSNEGALRDFVRAGPDGVWDLARRHLTNPRADSLAAARRAVREC
jgi:hypothetical protein